MLALLVVLQVIVAIFLILVVLLQPGNKGGMSAAFGGAGGETVFGGRGANTFLSKLTYGAAALFIVTSISLSFMSLPPKSVVQEALKKDAALAPANEPSAPASPAKNEANDAVAPQPESTESKKPEEPKSEQPE